MEEDNNNNNNPAMTNNNNNSIHHSLHELIECLGNNINNNTNKDVSRLLKKAANEKDGLSSIPQPIIRQSLDQVMKSLENLNAENLLNLQRIVKKGDDDDDDDNDHNNVDGARLCHGINVKPIHNEVKPQYYNDSSVVRYIHISEIPGKYSIGIFIFPPYSKIPLHDHPGMCVMSRLLYGDLQCLSLDIIKNSNVTNNNNHQQQQPQQKKSSWHNFFQLGSGNSNNNHHHQLPKGLPAGSKKAMKNHVTHLHAPYVTILYPYEGNLHEFFAGPQGAAVLDVLIPPYDTDQNRDCTFYDIYDEEEHPPTDIEHYHYHIDTSSTTTSNNNTSSATTGTAPPAQTATAQTETATTKRQQQQQCWVYPTDQPEDFHCLSGEYNSLG